MQKKKSAILDIGSSKITIAIGERGVNRTFLLKAKKEIEYDGFSEGAFLSIESLTRAIFTAKEFMFASQKDIDTVYVGVPGAFTEVVVKDAQISFPKKKKITEEDIDLLFDAAFVLPSSKYTLINRSAVVYELDDYRRLANPVGNLSVILKGKLSFVLCTNYFIEKIKPLISNNGEIGVEFVASSLAEALFLLEAETRDKTAMLVDVGYISTCFTLIQGDGILFQKAFDYGGGYITAILAEKYEIDFALAEKLKRKINLTKAETGAFALIELDGKYFPEDEIISLIKNSLDVLCENIAEAMELSGYAIPEYVPLMITGGGIAYLRGAKEHVSSRIGAITEIIAPDVPLMNKPTESSMLSLLDLVFEQN